MAAVFLKLLNLSISASWLVLAVLVQRSVPGKAAELPDLPCLFLLQLSWLSPTWLRRYHDALPSNRTPQQASL